MSVLSLLPDRVTIVEVGPRDGLQNEKTPVSVETKVQFINMLAASGLKVIEAGAFVSPKWVPQMADSAAVYAGIYKSGDIRFPMLVPNEQGMQTAVAAGVREVAVLQQLQKVSARRTSIAASMKVLRALCL